MVYIINYFLLFFSLSHLMLCSNDTGNTNRINKESIAHTSKNGSDTLLYYDTFVVGKQLYSLNMEADNVVERSEDSLLLAFEIDSSSYLLLFNPKIELDFLNDYYRDNIGARYIKEYYSRNKKPHLKKVVYADGGPFLTGFYSLYDSVILGSSTLNLYLEGKIDNFRNGDIDYVGITANANDKTYPYFEINSNIAEVLDHLKLPFNFKFPSQNFSIILTSNIKDFKGMSHLEVLNSSKCCDDIVILSFKNNRLVEIQLVDNIHMYYVLFSKKFSTYNVINP